jgi:hypothetical protein
MNSLRYSGSSETFLTYFFDDDNRADNLALLVIIPNMENRFQQGNMDAQPQRVLFDVSALQSGPLLASNEGSEDDGSNGTNFRRRLFADRSPTAALEEDNPSNLVTADSNITLENLPQLDDFLAEIADVANNAPMLEVDDFVLTNSSDCRKRYRVSYSKKFFYAASSIYLQVNPATPTPECLPELLGKITSCPSKKNDQHYTVKWIEQKDGGAWPATLTPHLRTTFPKELLHVKLAFLIGECPLNNNTTNSQNGCEFLFQHERQNKDFTSSCRSSSDHPHTRRSNAASNVCSNVYCRFCGRPFRDFQSGPVNKR